MNNAKFPLLIITLFFYTICSLTSQAQVKDSVSVSGNQVRAFQISFIPDFGTNGMQSAQIANHFSLNILAGVSGGTFGFELGGLVNIDRNEVIATQIAGIGNHGGIKTTGVQLAGIYNLSKVMTGTQVAGITNLTYEINGVQIAGISNHTLRGKSVQIGGLVNSTEERSAFQVAGLANHSRNNEGSQIAGLVNTTRDSRGSQIAGILNIAKNISGVQIGLINIADSSKGVPIGLINIIKNGYQRYEISADEFFQANIAYRSGVNKFHTFITAGIQPKTIGTPLWSYGAGLGTSQALSSSMIMDFDASFHHIVKKNEVGENYLYKAYLGFDRSLSSHLSLCFGISYNVLVTDIRNAHHEYYSDIEPYSFSNRNYNKFNLKDWVGVKVGLRFR